MDRKEVSQSLPIEAAERQSDRGDGIQPTADDIETARGEIVETVMLFGQWPQPSTSLFAVRPQRVQFLLSEFIANRENPDHEELAQFLVLALTDYSKTGAFADCRARWEKEITEQLEAHFSDDHALVQDRAQKIAEDAAVSREEAAQERRMGL